MTPTPDLRGRLVREMWDAVRTPLGRWFAFCLLVALAGTGLFLLGRAGLIVFGFAIVVTAVAFRDAVVQTLKSAIMGLRRHPFAMLCLPVALGFGLVLMETTLVGLAYGEDWFRYLVLDVAPRSATVAVLGSRPDAGGLDFTTISDAEVFQIYSHGLRRGYALTWTIPASLIKGMSTRPDAGYSFVNQAGWESWVNPLSYLGFRALCSVVAMTSVLSLLLLKARWINLIGSLEARHVASLSC